MPLPIALKPVERLLFRSDIVAIGSFRCPASHPLFADSGPCTHHTFVFPRTCTVIRHSGAPAFTATPNCVTTYNQKQEYSRRPISEADASDWYVVADDVLVAATGVRERPFRQTHVPIDARTYLLQRQLFEDAGRGVADPAEIDEAVLSLLSRVLEATPSRRINSELRDKVEIVKCRIATAPFRLLSLRHLAAASGLSPFHLCRAFRKVTGMSMTAYRHQLRVRMSLDALRRGRDVGALALLLGYASHSHFGGTFRRAFGMTPSQFRARPL
ncbi:MAG TPA: AraC family transcriptional regulator [Thermoanaerobaculia bacterium]|nr:AraC family transcriptional regulator [Thermoanaerobaculia bacterium]